MSDAKMCSDCTNQQVMLLAHLLWPRGPHVCASGRGMQAGRWRCAIAGPCAGKPCAAFGWVVQRKSLQAISWAPHTLFVGASDSLRAFSFMVISRSLGFS